MNLITVIIASVTKSLELVRYFFFPLNLKGVPPTLHTTPYGEYFLEEEPQRGLPTLKESKCLNAQLWWHTSVFPGHVAGGQWMSILFSVAVLSSGVRESEGLVCR